MKILIIIEAISLCLLLFCMFNLVYAIFNSASIFAIGIESNRNPLNNTLVKGDFTLLYTESSTIVNRNHNFTISYDVNTKQLLFKDNNNYADNFHRQLSNFEEQYLKKIILLNSFFEIPTSFPSHNEHSIEYDLNIKMNYKIHTIHWSNSSFYLPIELTNVANEIRSLAFEGIVEHLSTRTT